MSQAHTEFKLMEEEQLSVELIEAQYALKNTKGEKNAKSLLILVSGIELAGKESRSNNLGNGSIRVI